MWALVLLCSVLFTQGVQGWTTWQYDHTGTDQVTSCGGYMYNYNDTFQSPNYPNAYPNNLNCIWYIRPGGQVIRLEFFNLDTECNYDWVTIYDGYDTSSRVVQRLCSTHYMAYHSTGSYLTVQFRTDGSVTKQGFRASYRVVAESSCRFNCGYQAGNCSCLSGCEYRGTCCADYTAHCGNTTAQPELTSPQPTAHPTCRYNCGYDHGSCSCSYSCQYYGNCCPDFHSYCGSTTQHPVTARPSCRNNCGRHMGSCSCSSSCRYNGNCCHDYYSYCGYNTVYPTTSQPSCRYNCGYHLGSCSCQSSCQWNGNCCHDYHSYCDRTTDVPATARPSCRYNCGYHLGSCSCQSSCQWNGNCCHDYHYYCGFATPTPAQPSCRYNCGRHMGSCSCHSSCRYNGTCCHDFHSYCYVETTPSAGSCGGSLYGSGTFTSPNHPGHYNDNSYCVWQLRAAYDQRIFLEFSYLQLENCCNCDYISIYDGPSVNSAFLGKVCNNTQNTFHSTSSYMTVLFRTDSSVVGRGFSADFTSSLKPSSGRTECSSDNMNIILNRAYLSSLGYDGHNLSLNDPHCRPRISSYDVVFSFPLNSCGNIRRIEKGRVMYTNNVRGWLATSGEITRHSHLKMNVTCLMEPDSVSQITFVVRHTGNNSITGSGRYNTSMAFYTSSSFYYPVTEVPYMVVLNQNLYVQVDLRRPDSGLVLFLDTCKASPSPFDFESRPYYLVRDGCSVDNTYRPISSGSVYRARFSFRAFQFLRGTESVYLQCKVLICPASDSNSRCRRGCRGRAARELESEHESQTLVVGPIQLKESEKEKEAPEKQSKV
ncbi:deleted in malignant brain tumors 1 protein isoform X3 [Fundulus heteroclitus]|uniref:deleted in malignant brain tumors 1 protein isoform X3 n=1 Tax=Fundulus heteroclitus TaxID=8078 RepID=UPI00165BC592|nr:deleted in malignant brain tumors 1 protein isoform X3 [Fundulus heteroclitus]